MEVLDILGKIIIESRDEAISDNIQMIDGKMKGPYCEYIIKKIENFSDPQKDILKEVLIKAVDNVLHDLLSRFYNETDNLYLGVKSTEDVEFQNAQQISDGLSGELFSEEGWIAKFGKYPSIYNEI